MNVKPMDWWLNYEAIFRHISQPQVKAWEQWLHANLHGGVTKTEVDEIVAELCDTWTHPTRHPGVKDLLFAIIRHRNRHSGRHGEISKEPAIDEAELRAMRLMRACKDPAERWEIMCTETPQTQEGFLMCERLEKWAGESLPGGITDGRPAVAAALRGIIAGLNLEG